MKWKVVPIGDVILSSQYGLSTPSDSVGSVPIVGMKDIQDGRVRIDPDVRVVLSDDDAKAYLLHDGDILINRTNSPDLVGKAGIYRGNGKAVFASYLVRLELDRTRIDPDFLIQILTSEDGQRRIKQLATRAVSQANLNPTTFKNHFQVCLPPLEDQSRIRDILLTWDAAIDRVERTIAAKEQRHRGLMLRLLLGTAFPLKRLSDLVERVGRKNTTGNDHPLTISGKDGLIPQHRFFDKRIAAEATENYTLLKRGEFAYNKSYSSGYPYGAIKRLDSCDEGIVSSLYLCFAMKQQTELLSDYLAYFCEAGGFNHQIHQIAQEGARNHGLLNVAVDDFFALKIPVPNIAHQRRVVEVLAESDLELANLRKLLKATRLQKRGLTQKLLTGEWRQPVLEEAPA
ncbi:restriction endonuclease subunit S [Burkholderia gladioli]|uniref:restriction endonuclease subunit S n=1 Tax=Burkholderia gladioli TaxID=28095 RepID=UPI00163F314D|nr:restriction endonuclease subunit S [Burkholderia gladioli]